MPFESAPHERAPYGSRDLELRQPGYLYTPIGPHVQPNDPSRQCYPVSQISPDEVFHGITEYTESPTLRQQQAQQKKARQWAKWTDDVIPILLQHFLTILCESESLRKPVFQIPICTCLGPATQLKVACVYFECKHTVLILTSTNGTFQELRARLFTYVVAQLLPCSYSHEDYSHVLQSCQPWQLI